MKCKSSHHRDNPYITVDLAKIISGDDELRLQFRKALGLTARQFGNYLNETIKQDKCQVVVVTEMVDTKPIGVTAFPDTFDGNKQAEALFKQLHQEHNDPDGTTDVEPPTEEDFTAMLDDGIYDDNCGYQLIITHSL